MEKRLQEELRQVIQDKLDELIHRHPFVLERGGSRITVVQSGLRYLVKQY